VSLAISKLGLSVRFLGVRGSIPVPGPLTTAGGNTACVEVTAGDTRIILDAGSGLRSLGNERKAHGPRHSTILLSHLHWDHVCGLPFFTPIYVPGHRVEIASGPNGVMPTHEAIRALFRAPFFPVDFADIAPQVTVRELPANDRFTIGDITITLGKLNHPDPVYGSGSSTPATRSPTTAANRSAAWVWGAQARALVAGGSTQFGEEHVGVLGAGHSAGLPVGGAAGAVDHVAPVRRERQGLAVGGEHREAVEPTGVGDALEVAAVAVDREQVGKVEAADKGTLFLDEIGELPLPLQGKLLRFVQDRQFERGGGRETLTADVRLVAATNRDLAAMASAGQFRSDLYFRLRVVEIEIPPLRARRGDDIADLAAHFVDQFVRRYRKPPLRLDDATRPALAAYAWPGNVRELENTIECAVVMCPGTTIGVKDLGLPPRGLSGVFEIPAWPGGPASENDATAPTAPTAPTAGAPGATTAPPADGTIRLPDDLALAEAERRYALAVLERCDGNQSAAARQLGISRNKLARLLKP
jgi:hypothetical protein